MGKKIDVELAPIWHRRDDIDYFFAKDSTTLPIWS